MFEKKAPILYITRTHALLYDGIQVQHPPFVATWNGADVPGLLKLMKQHTNESGWHVVLGNEYAYLLTLPVTKEQANNAYIQQELARRIPEDITEENFAWHILPSSTHQPVVTVQTFVIPASLLQSLKMAYKDLHLSLQSITALPLVLAQETRAFQKPHITYWFDQENICLVSYQGAVYHSESFSQITDIQVQHVMQFAQKQLSQPVTTVVTNGDFTGTIVSTLFQPQQIMKHAFQPIVWLVEQKGSGDQLLCLQPGAYHAVPRTVVSTPPVSSPSSATARSGNRLYILLGFLMLLLLFTAWYAYTFL